MKKNKSPFYLKDFQHSQKCFNYAKNKSLTKIFLNINFDKDFYESFLNYYQNLFLTLIQKEDVKLNQLDPKNTYNFNLFSNLLNEDLKLIQQNIENEQLLFKIKHFLVLEELNHNNNFLTYFQTELKFNTILNGFINLNNFKQKTKDKNLEALYLNTHSLFQESFTRSFLKLFYLNHFILLHFPNLSNKNKIEAITFLKNYHYFTKIFKTKKYLDLQQSKKMIKLKKKRQHPKYDEALSYNIFPNEVFKFEKSKQLILQHFKKQIDHSLNFEFKFNLNFFQKNLFNVCQDLLNSNFINKFIEVHKLNLKTKKILNISIIKQSIEETFEFFSKNNLENYDEKINQFEDIYNTTNKILKSVNYHNLLDLLVSKYCEENKI